MGIPWPVAFGGTSENPWRTPQKLLEPQQARYIRPALLVDSFFFIEFITVYLALMVNPSHPYNPLPCSGKAAYSSTVGSRLI